MMEPEIGMRVEKKAKGCGGTGEVCNGCGNPMSAEDDGGTMCECGGPMMIPCPGCEDCKTDVDSSEVAGSSEILSRDEWDKVFMRLIRAVAVGNRTQRSLAEDGIRNDRATLRADLYDATEHGENLEFLLDKTRAALAESQREVERLRKALAWCAEISWDGCDIDGGGFQDEMVERGILVEVPADAAFKAEWGFGSEVMYVLAWSRAALNETGDET